MRRAGADPPSRPGVATDPRANLVGGAWMIVSMAAFAVEDTFVKAASGIWPVGHILIVFGLGGSLIFAAIARSRGERLSGPDILSRPMCIRFLFEIVGRLFYVIAISLIPLSAATVILQATPLVVVAGAALLFGERVGHRRWTAILVGLSGVVVILRPGTESFSMLSLLAVVGMLGFAGRDLASRAAPASIGTSVLGVYGFLAVLVAGVLVTLWEGAPFAPFAGSLSAEFAPRLAIYLAGSVIAGTTAYYALMRAMRTGEVSAVTPFRYTRLLFGVVLGVVWFGEELDRTTLFGCALVVLSGLFIVWRGKRAGTP